MTAAGSRRRVRIVSYNVHGCVGLDGRFRPDRIADVLASLDADIVALQEVEDRRFAGGRVSAYLAERLRMDSHRGPTLRRGDADYGNLLLSRHDAIRLQIHDLSVPGREARGAIEAEFDLGGHGVRMIATHFGLTGAERSRQLRQLLPALDREGADVRVLAGDLNEWRPIAGTHRSLRRVFGRGPRPRTFPARAPVLALDRICVAPRRVVARLEAVSSPIARVASDHLPLSCELRLG